PAISPRGATPVQRHRTDAPRVRGGQTRASAAGFCGSVRAGHGRGARILRGAVDMPSLPLGSREPANREVEPQSQRGSRTERRPRPRARTRRGATLYAWSYEHVLFPAWQRIVHGRPIFGHLARLDSSQWMSRDELDALVVRHLRELLAYAGQN